MKKYFSLLVLMIIIFNYSFNTYASPSIESEAAILIDADSGEVLYEKNPHKIMYPASTTKIMTGILAIENGNLNEIVTVDNKSPFEIEGTHIALDVGEKLTLNDLLHALLIESANDSAQVIAKHISGSVETFANLMNEKAKEIGALNTNFTNPHGLHDPNHTTTAYDLAIIAKYAMENPKFREIVNTTRYVIEPTNMQPDKRYLTNGNKLLYAVGSGNKINVNGNLIDIKYEGTIGVKTGYTSKAMNCVVSSAKIGNKTLISVVLKSPKNIVWVDSHKLLNYGFNNFINKQVAFEKQFIENIEVENGDVPFVTGIVAQELSLNINKSDSNRIEKKVILNEKIKAPVTKGQVLGKIEWIIDKETIAVSNIVAASEANITPVQEVIKSASEKTSYVYIPLGILGLFIIFRLYIKHLKRKRRRIKRRQKYHF